jgi:hypothetical protein
MLSTPSIQNLQHIHLKSKIPLPPVAYLDRHQRVHTDSRQRIRNVEVYFREKHEAEEASADLVCKEGDAGWLGEGRGVRGGGDEEEGFVNYGRGGGGLGCTT